MVAGVVIQAQAELDTHTATCVKPRKKTGALGTRTNDPYNRVAAFQLTADCTLGTGDVSVVMLRGLSETLHHIYLQEIDIVGRLVM